MTEKLLAARTRGHLRSVDLFAGCGGMTLGFHREGIRCISAVELNDAARSSHALNFGRVAPSEGYSSHANVTTVTPAESIAHLHPLFPDDDAVDVVIGGPPCQAFSRLGRAALWDLAGKKHAHGQDARATMYHYFLEYVAELRPIAFVMENVREIGKFVGRNVAEEIAVTADALGYETRYALLNAAWYGVPQLRERMIIIGINKELGISPTFPRRTHRYDLPVGYSTSRAGKGTHEVLQPADHYVDHADNARTTHPAVTAADAFCDLPPILEHLDGRTGKGRPRDPLAATKYLEGENDFTRLMRNWPHFVSGASFTGHVIRYTPRDYETFRRMPAGGMYPEAVATAELIFQERLKKARRSSGKSISEGSAEWLVLRSQTVPPYRSDRYPNKFRKMWADHPARTVPAHIGKDSYSHIHFDSAQARCISLREAARLQSFPDAFRLSGSMNEQLTQIGNAVPPLMAAAIARNLKRQLLSSLRTHST